MSKSELEKNHLTKHLGAKFISFSTALGKNTAHILCQACETTHTTPPTPSEAGTQSKDTVAGIRQCTAEGRRGRTAGWVPALRLCTRPTSGGEHQVRAGTARRLWDRHHLTKKTEYGLFFESYFSANNVFKVPASVHWPLNASYSLLFSLH